MFERFHLLFSLAPISRGLIAMFLSGASFPICGVMVLRLNLINMRYMLMHGVILGGAISLAMNIPLIPVTIIINLCLIFLMMFFTKDGNHEFSGGAAASMIISMALSSLVMHIADVPAKDTLNLLWGSPFALTKIDLLVLFAISSLLILYVIFNFKNILAIFFNVDIAKSLGINVRFHYSLMVCVIAIVVAVAMKLLGAFLIDSLLVLPVLTGAMLEGKKIGGIKKLFIISSILGLCFSVVGYFVAVMINWPPASTISILAGIVYTCFAIINKVKINKKREEKK